MACLDGFSGVDGMVAWISSTTLCPEYANATSPSPPKTPNTLPGVVDARRS